MIHYALRRTAIPPAKQGDRDLSTGVHAHMHVCTHSRLVVAAQVAVLGVNLAQEFSLRPRSMHLFVKMRSCLPNVTTTAIFTIG